MKNNIAIILIAGAVAAPALTQAQGGQGQQRRGHGAPNSLSNNQQGGQSGSTNRGTLRRPYNNENQEGNQGQTGQGRGSQSGGQSGRGNGMSTTETGGQGGRGNNGQQTGSGRPWCGTVTTNGQQTGSGQQGRGNSIQERLNLTEEQLSKLRAAYKVWKEYAKSVRQNQELTQEEKQVKLKAGFEEYDAKVKEILTEEQYAKLVEIRRNASRPNQNNGNTGNGGNEQNGHSRAEHRRELRQVLNLTEEQLTKFRAIHQYATNKIRAILANEELSREEKSAQIKEVKKQANNRRMQVLTEEQKEKLRQWRAEHRAEHQQQSGNNGQQTGSGQRERGNNGQTGGQRGGNGGQTGGQRGGNNGQTGGQRGGNSGQTGGQRGGNIGQTGGQRGGNNGQTGGQRGGNTGQTGGQRGGNSGQTGGQRGGNNGQTGGQRGGNSGQTGGQQTGNGQQGRGNNGQQTSQSDQVILYTIPNCGYCTKAAKLLQDNGIDFVKKNIASDQAARAELGRKTREAGIQWRGGVPVTDARGDIIVGYNRTALNRIQ
jgi:glutaredoxin/Spy/CpxP family protein refolding chaperone